MRRRWDEKIFVEKKLKQYEERFGESLTKPHTINMTDEEIIESIII